MLKITPISKEPQVTQEETAPSYDASVLPYNNRVRTSTAKLDENLRAGQQALLDMSNIFQPMIGMGLNELTEAGVTVSRAQFTQLWAFGPHAQHTLSPNGNRSVIFGHVRSRSGILEYNCIVTVAEDGTVEMFVPMRARPFEERTSYDTPRFRRANNGVVRVEKAYRTNVQFTVNDPETGENSYENIVVYLCPTMEKPDDIEFANLGDQLGISTVHAMAPEAIGEGIAEAPKSRGRRANRDDEGSDNAPAALE